MHALSHRQPRPSTATHLAFLSLPSFAAGSVGAISFKSLVMPCYKAIQPSERHGGHSTAAALSLFHRRFAANSASLLSSDYATNRRRFQTERERTPPRQPTVQCFSAAALVSPQKTSGDCHHQRGAFWFFGRLIIRAEAKRVKSVERAVLKRKEWVAPGRGCVACASSPPLLPRANRAFAISCLSSLSSWTTTAMAAAEEIAAL